MDRREDGNGVPSLRDSELFLEEYKSLREESSQARQAQQSVLQWSLGAYGIVFAGGLAFAGNNPDAFVEFSITFGLALPGLIFAGCLVWWGEVIRMERVGYYLRGRERATWAPDRREQKPEPAGLLTTDLFWENYIAFVGSGLGKQKQQVGYVGAVAIYGGSLVFSLMLFCSRWKEHPFESNWHKDGATAWAVLAILVFLGVSLWLKRGLKRLGEQAAGFS